MKSTTRSILWIWALALITATVVHLLLRHRVGREVALGVTFFIYASVAWPGFRILARQNGHGLSPLLYFSASAITSVVMAIG